MSPDTSLITVNRLRGGWQRSRGSIPGNVARFFSFLKRSDRLWGPLCLLFSGLWMGFSRGLSDRDVNLTTHFHPVSNLRMSGAILPPPYLFLVWTCRQVLMTRTIEIFLYFFSLCRQFSYVTFGQVSRAPSAYYSSLNFLIKSQSNFYSDRQSWLYKDEGGGINLKFLYVSFKLSVYLLQLEKYREANKTKHCDVHTLNQEHCYFSGLCSLHIINALRFADRPYFLPQMQTCLADPLVRGTLSHWAQWHLKSSSSVI
jgi:hypothetical protein